ncbi:hypothetical protein QQX98_002473 [Neonectria punicea]|uniref:Protein kinase domain-containing protein n=1 Tax=Neonectria punicea TaxID=979145 RepID=A0ABR1HID7_9HYPO
MDLVTPDGKEVQVTITRICSVTVSPVMEVQLRTPNGCEKAILKLFDRRFGEFRKRHPYNQKAEMAWQDSIRSGLAKSRLEELQHDQDMVRKARFQDKNDDDPDEEDIEGEEEEEEEDEEEEDDDEDEDENDLKEEEAIIYHSTRKFHASEVRAYTQLKAFQGKHIPRFIASVIDNSPPAPADLPTFYFQNPGILLEYIDGFSLSEMTSRIPNQPRCWEKIVEDAIDMVKAVNKAGVVHHDCQPRNILVAEMDQGVFQPYLIDFSQCAFRSDYKDTEDVDDENGFAYIIHSVDNHGGVAVLMKQRVKRTTPFTINIKGMKN